MIKAERLEKMEVNPIYKRIVEICEEAGYGVDRAYITSYGEPRIGIYAKDTSFQSFYPSIYVDVKYDWKNNCVDSITWKIQTTSYGSLPLKEYERMMDIQIGAMRMVRKLERLAISKLERLPDKFDDDDKA